MKKLNHCTGNQAFGMKNHFMGLIGRREGCPAPFDSGDKQTKLVPVVMNRVAHWGSSPHRSKSSMACDIGSSTGQLGYPFPARHSAGFAPWKSLLVLAVLCLFCGCQQLDNLNTERQMYQSELLNGLPTRHGHLADGSPYEEW
jgi:hypothetical protein